MTDKDCKYVQKLHHFMLKVLKKIGERGSPSPVTSQWGGNRPTPRLH